MLRTMQAKLKLQEAEYFLGGLKRSETNPVEFNYNLSAFLSALSSVPDIMLYDFAEKYSLGITREVQIGDTVFRSVANALKKKDALNFLEWWRENLGQLVRNKLLRKRAIIVHRGYPPTYQKYVVNTSSQLIFHPVSWGNINNTGEFDFFTYATGDPIESDIPTPYTKSQIRFHDFPNQSALDVCQESCDMVRKFVETAEKEYWAD